MHALLDSAFLDALRRSPAGEKIATQQAQEQLARRRELVARKAAIDAREATEWPRLTAKIEKAVAHALECEKRLQDARAAAFATQNERGNLAMQANAERGAIDLELSDTASPLIAAFKHEMHRTLDAARKAIETISESRTDFLTGRIESVSGSNSESVAERVRAIMGALDAADLLALDADQSKVAAKLDELRAALPSVEKPTLPNEARK